MREGKRKRGEREREQHAVIHIYRLPLFGGRSNKQVIEACQW